MSADVRNSAGERIAFFGHNAKDAAIRRRVLAFERAGFSVHGFMMRRGDPIETPWSNVDLGRTYDNAYVHRSRSIFSGAERALQHLDVLERASLLYARNLDMLACAGLVRYRAKLDIPLVFECLDIHKQLTSRLPTASLLRGVEARLLKQCSLVVCSSPAFYREYFDRHYRGRYRPFLLENRFIEGDDFAPRDSVPAKSFGQGQPLRIGWFGNIRCRRSMDLMQDLCRRFGDRVRVVIRGYPSDNVFPHFQSDVSAYPQLSYGGRYAAPKDLAVMNQSIDLQWGGDYHEAGANSVWLLPNRLYEAGYYNTPLICPGETETAQWISRHRGGFTIGEPVEETLPALVEKILSAPQLIAEASQNLAALPDELFVEDRAFSRKLFDAAMGFVEPAPIGLTR